MTSKIVKAWGAAYLRQMLITLAVTAIIVPLACVCIGVPLYIAQNGNYDDTTTFLIMSMPSLGFVLLVIGGSFGFAAFVLWRRARQLDEAFMPLGLSGKMYLTNGRQYHGLVNGRPVDAYFYRGPTLEVYLGTSLKTRLGIGAKDRVGQALAGLLKRQPFSIGDADLDHLSLYALDETWARELLNDPAAKAALLRLTTEATGFELRQLHLQPEAFLLRLYQTNTKLITADNLRQWLTDLQTLARIAESLPAPQQTAEASRLERNTRSNRGAFILPAIGVVVGLLCIISLCAIVPVVFLLVSEASR